MQKLNILYISYHYPPTNSIGANRSFFQVSALRYMGHKVKVVHASNNDHRFIKNESHSAHHDDISIEMNYSSINKLYNKSFSIKAFIISNLNPLAKFLIALKTFFFNEEASWNTASNMQNIINQLDEFKPNLIISTCGPIENHSLASKFKKLYSCSWVAEYRDCWSYNTMTKGTSPSQFISKLNRLKERKIINTTDLILAVNPFIRDYYATYFNKRSYLILSGWMDHDQALPNPVLTFKQKHKRSILHLGSMLLGKRSPKPFIDIFERNSLLRENFNIYFIGRDTSLFKGYLEKSSHAKSSVFLENEINFLQSRAEGKNADILLLLMMDFSGERYGVPGKIYEYIYLQKPIIIMDSNNSEASKIIEKYRLGYICKSEDEFEELLIKIIQEDNLLTPNEEARNKFKVINTMQHFIEHLDKSSIIKSKNS